jgi:hypothetical protein
MTAFDTAWALLKEWTPDWRDTVRDVAPLPTDEMLNIPKWEEGMSYDAWRHKAREGMMPQMHSLPRYIDPYVHPLNPKFVVKRGGNMADSDADYQSLAMAIRANPFRVSMEELGLPIVSEYNYPNTTFNVQPRLISGAGDHWKSMALGGSFDGGKTHHNIGQITDAIVGGLTTDRHGDNIGIDSQGMPRWFDYDLGGGIWSAGINWGDEPDAKKAERIMNFLQERGVDFPATALINELPKMTRFLDRLEAPYGDEDYIEEFRDELENNQANIRQYLETVEPYASNTQTLRLLDRPWHEVPSDEYMEFLNIKPR